MSNIKIGIWLRLIKIVQVVLFQEIMVKFSFLFVLCLRYFEFLVEESTEKLVNALHDAAKRGNIEFLQQSLANKVEKKRILPQQ
jgi:hypothetical protein